MGSAWDRITDAFADAKEVRQNTSIGERLAKGIDAGLGYKRPDQETLDAGSSWERVFGQITTPPIIANEPAETAWGRVMNQYAPAPANQSSAGNKVDASYIKTGLIKRGLSPQVAEAFVWNMQDESGLDSGINEIAPLVKGSRGGYGLYQLTGPRRRQYEALADERGVAYNDTDLQLDFLVWELENTEKRAGQKLQNVGSTEEAASIIVNDFLRPAKEHRISRTNKYLSGGMSPIPTQKITGWKDLL